MHVAGKEENVLSWGKMVQGGIDGRKRFSIAHPSDGTVMFTQLRPSVQPPKGDVLATPATLAARMNATDRMVGASIQ